MPTEKSLPTDEDLSSGRLLFHYLGALAVMSIYGVQVCPYIESLSALQIVLPLVLVMGAQFAVRQKIANPWVVGSPHGHQVMRRFRTELALFTAAGAVLAVGNTLAFHFPLGSGVKLMVGYSTLGFLAAVDLSLEQEWCLAHTLKAKGLHIEAQGAYVPLARKFALFATVILLGLLVVFFLVINKDLSWLTQGERPLMEAQRAILGEFAFVVAIYFIHLQNLIHSYARNLSLFFNNENTVLSAATAGDLEKQVPVSTHDEFGEIARHTNTMIAALRHTNDQLRRTQEATIVSLGSLAESRDPETGAHILRTQRYVKVLAQTLQQDPAYAAELDDATIELLFQSAPLHDIGKVGIPDHILLKPGKLTDDEFKIMKTHAPLGAKALAAAQTRLGNQGFLRLAREIALTHHEKWDGSGYPAGKKGDAIPLSGRLMAVADVYDALISKRVYKPAFSHEKAREIILAGNGSHFDPRIIAAFLDTEDRFKEIAAQFGDQEHP